MTKGPTSLETFSELSSSISRIQEQTEPHLKVFQELQRRMEVSGLAETVSRIQEQAESLHNQINQFRLDPDLSSAALQVDQALDISRRAVWTTLTDESVSDEQLEDEVSVERTGPADHQRIEELRAAQHMVVADAVAQLFAVIGIDPYLLAIWVETVTSDDATLDEVRDMNAGLIDALNREISPDNEPDDS